MRKQSLLAGSVLSVAFLFAAAVAFAGEPSAVVPAGSDSLAALFNPAPVSLTSCTTCVGPWTIYGQALGSSCSAAQASLNNSLNSNASADCYNLDDFGLCSFAVTVINECYYNYRYQAYVIYGSATYKCRVWANAPGCIRP
jgi:hypothetical protein